jgi:hypothetical protein
MRSLFGVPHNSWFRGNLEGIPTQYIARLLSLRHKLSWNILSQVTLQAMLEQKAVRSPQGAIDKARAAKKLPSIGYRGILTQLREWIDRMHPADTARSVWGDYAKANTYSSTEIENKAQAIREFVSTVRPATLIDLGCNSGDFSIASLEAGAGRVVGFDFDHQAVEEAFARSFREKLNFLPLWLDAANPSPDQGWNQAERLGFGKRAQADAVIALAFEHHLIIGKNIPMAETVAWLVSLAPSGIIEFIPKSDATIQQMLALRDDIFPDYSEENFANILRSHANIVRTKIVSASGRTLYCFQK